MGLDLEALRSEWRERYGAPPRFRSRELLAFALAYRIQAEREGGLSADARRSLRRHASKRTVQTVQPGSVIVREWQGVQHAVTALADGAFAYGGDTYASLSMIARRITGTRWNGPRFFGLRNEEQGV